MTDAKIDVKIKVEPLDNYPDDNEDTQIGQFGFDHKEFKIKTECIVIKKEIPDDDEVDNDEEIPDLISENDSDDSDFDPEDLQDEISEESEKDQKTQSITSQLKNGNECKNCGKSFSSCSALYFHKRTVQVHDGIEKSKCSTCGKTFTRRSALMFHVNAEHKKSNFLQNMSSFIYKISFSEYSHQISP